MRKDLLDLKNPTVGQLMYMKDLYAKETLISYMATKWETQFNTEMTDKDWKQYHFELEHLQLDSSAVLIEIPDWCNL